MIDDLEVEKNRLNLEAQSAIMGALVHAKNVTELWEAAVTTRNITRFSKDGEIWKPATDAIYDIMSDAIKNEMAAFSRNYNHYKFFEAKLNSKRLVK